MYSLTNYHSLDNLSEYVSAYDKEDNVEFDSINLAAKIMPSYNIENNALFMDHSIDVFF